MKTMENDKKKLCRCTAGYILGLVASVLSFMVCLITGILVFSFANLFRDVFGELWEKIYQSTLLSDLFSNISKFLGNVLYGGTVFFIVIVIGFILGFIGTIMSWRKSTIFSAIVMIIGGIFSIFSLIFPGVFLIIGGVLNIRCALDNKK